jgi:hypothetical protein
MTELLRAVTSDLEALERAVAAHGNPALQPLDYSYESLDRVEDYLREVIDTQPTEVRAVTELRIARYLGQTLIHRAGGRWARRRSDAADLAVTGLPELGGFGWLPRDPVVQFRNARVAGLLRDTTEKYDVPRREGELVQRGSAIDAEIDGLRDDIHRLTDHAPVLDRELDSLDSVEAALRLLISTSAPREVRRRVRGRAVLYLAAVMIRALGPGPIALCKDPHDGDFGELIVHDFAPMTLVRNTNPRSRAHFLASALRAVIEGRRVRQ